MIPLRPSHVWFYAGVVTVTVAIAAAGGFWFIRREMLTGNDFLLDAESKEIIARVTPVNPPTDAQKLQEALREHTELDEALFYFQAQDPAQGRVIYRSPNLGSNELPVLSAGLAKSTLNLAGIGLAREGEYNLPQLRLQIAMSLRNFQTVGAYFWRMLLIGLPVIALLSVAVGEALRRSTLRPVRIMQDMARRITANNLSERISIPKGDNEMAALARLLNGMFDRLEQSFKQVKRFTADTSHELMTPLSMIRLHAERLQNDAELPEKSRHSVEELLSEVLHLTETLESLMVLTKADSAVLLLRLKPHSTREFISQFSEDAHLLAENRGLKLVFSRNDERVATFDQGWIRQVLFNLLSNALRFSPPGGTITFNASSTENSWTVEVLDEGPGVPEERLKDIFERFVQIAPRSEPGSGSGLGLAVCKSIVQLHKGQIFAQNRADRAGFSVSFTLPLQNGIS